MRAAALETEQQGNREAGGTGDCHCRSGVRRS
jgi:hypothetical protein